MERTKLILGHLSHPVAGVSMSSTAATTRQSPPPSMRVSDDDVVIVSALRTPICKAKRGGFKDTLPDDLLSAAFSAVIKDAGIAPSLIQDICVGNVMQPGAGANIARMAQFMSHIPETVTLHTTNRFCSSGLQACATIAANIKAGYIDIGIGAGVESLSLNEMGRLPPGMALNPRAMENAKAATVLIPMGITSENVAKQFGITREKQDQFAQLSHAKAGAAQKQGLFDAEIVPVATQLIDKDGNETKVIISKDDGVRADTTLEGLAKLKPAFQQGGSTTAGNASQTSDGAAAVILARRSFAAKHRLPVLGVFRSFAVVGVPPEVMGIGPAYAIPEALKQAGLTLEDIDVFEINEAFASQAVYCVEKLGIPIDKVNPKGGAIAFGHPLGCTGARQVATLLHELKRRKNRSYGVVSMCIGTGMGAAAVIEYPGGR
jgi:acetyl-CoA acyltransferase 1